MKAFSIDSENNITVHASRAAARETGDGVFATEEQLAELIGPDGKRLVAIWNSLTGVTPVKKFMNNKAAARRIFAAIQKLEPEASAAADVTEPEAAPEAEPEKKIRKAPKAKKERAAKAEPGTASAPREGSKASQVIAMLQREGGATLEELNAAMGWQAHTTRALMSAGGALRKKFGITVVSQNVDDKRTYSIA